MKNILCFGKKKCIRSRLLWVIILGIFVTGMPTVALSEEPTQITTVIIPINMAFPLLPVQTIIIDNTTMQGDFFPVILTDQYGIMAILRISARD